jgi:S-adenosylmethionine decarboxylase proenzyme
MNKGLVMIHAVFDITHCQHSHLPAEEIMTAMRQTAQRLGCTTRAQLIEPFQPHGATCVLILAESHITVSTWPERRLAHIDVFTCRADTDPVHAIEPIISVLGGRITRSQAVPRLSPNALLEPDNTNLDEQLA